MAEPLLKRTFSRLRGKDRPRRKWSDVPVKPDTLLQTSSSSSSSVKTPTRAADPDPPSPPQNHITVAKKQSWVWQGSAAPPTTPPSNSTLRASERERPSWITQDAPGQARSAGPAPGQLQGSDTAFCSDRMCTSLARDTTSTSCAPASCLQPAGGAPDTKSGQGAYLQSLERSSRAWLLSSGKSQASYEASGLQAESSSNIWYNPIPEEEDAGGAQRGEVWRRRCDTGEGRASRTGPGDTRAETGGGRATSPESFSSECPPEGANPSVSHHVDDITTADADCPASDSSPATQKKGGSGSVIDRLRSPGTVRKLSLKMKKLPELRRKLSLRSSSRGNRQENSRGEDDAASKNVTSAAALSNQNVISRYHLDSSAPPARPMRRSSRGRSASKGGYLSDGDSPELLPRQQASSLTASQDTTCDISSFQLYAGSNPQRCSQRMTGLLTVHLLGLEEMKTSRSEDSKVVFLAIQIDGVTRARTALLTLRGPALSLNHAFHLELERARLLRVVVLTPVSAAPQAAGGSRPGMDQGQPSGGPTRNRVCCLGGVSIPPLFKGSRSQQLCVKLEPRGRLYVKLSLQERWDTQPNSDTSLPANVFGVELHHLVDKEGSASPIPLLIQKCVAEIERRGLKVVGLYRLCGSAAIKKELRDWFERNSSAVCLSEDLYPDINVITGILKDYLRELPSQLITRTLYQVVREAMIRRPPPANPDPALARSTVELLSCLPAPERATLSLLLDHLSLVASFSSSNRMTHQNLAVCFGPVLLTPTQEAWRAGGGGAGGGRGRGGGKGGEEVASAIDFKRHIEALHYLLQLWPVPTHRIPAICRPPACLTHNPLGQQQQPALPSAPPQSHEEETVVSRRGRGSLARLESPPPINRYAGDWSVCGRALLSGQEADYDEVAGSESDAGSGDEEEKKEEGWPPAGGALFVDDFIDFDAPFNCRLSLKDFDTLIHDLDRELAKQINICL